MKLLPTLVCAIAFAGAALPAAGAMRGTHPPKFTLAVGATLAPDGRLWLVQADAGRLLVSHSDDDGAHFSAPVAALAQPEAVVAESETRPRIAVARDRSVLLAWTLDTAKKYSGDIRVVHSGDGGKTWGAPRTLNDDARVTTHRFPSLASDGRGRVALVWLDARDRDAYREAHPTAIADAARAPADDFAGISLYAAESTDNGRHFAPNRRIAAHTCECCRTAMTWSTEGPVAFWRNLYDSNTRDFALRYLDRDDSVRATDDDWRIDACPHQGGGVAADASGRVHMVWFTNGTARQGLFYANRSGDRTSRAIALGNPDADASRGDVAAAGRTVLVTWREFDGTAYSAMAMRSDDGGASWLPPQRLARSAGLADYPLPLTDGRRALVVWRTADEGLRVLPVAASVQVAATSPLSAAPPTVQGSAR